MKRIIKKNNDNILIFFSFVLLAASSFAILWFSDNKGPKNDLSPTPKVIGRAGLIINFGNGENRSFEGDIVENETLISVLVQAAKAGNFSYRWDEKSNLAAIDDFNGKSKKSWHWYLNDIKIDKKPGEIVLKAGDRITIKYE